MNANARGEGAAQEKIVKLLPPKQRLSIEFKVRLEELTRRHPEISLSLSDPNLRQNLPEVLGKIGFEVNLSGKTADKDVVKNLVAWRAKGHLALIHYRPETGSGTVINILRAVKQQAPFFSFETVIPIFFAAAAQEKQREIFQALGKFGVVYAIFLTPGAGVEQNLEELLNGLEAYLGASGAEPETPGTKADTETAMDTQTVRRYAGLVEEGERLMAERKYAEAVTAFTQALDIKPDFAALVRRGDAYYRLRRYAEALRDFRQAHALALAAPAPYARMGACLFILAKESARRGDGAGAKQLVDQGMEALENAGRIIEKLEREPLPENRAANPWGDMVTALVEADLRGLGHQTAEQAVARLLFTTLEKTKDIDYSDGALDVETRVDMALLLARGAMYPEAERILASLPASDPEIIGPALNNYAVELRKNGESEKAFDTLLRLLDMPIAHRDIVVVNMAPAARAAAAGHRAGGRADRAIAIYERALSRMSKSHGKEWLLLDLALACLEKQDQAQAGARLVEAMYINPALFGHERFKRDYADLASLKEELIKKFTRGAL